MDIFHFHPTTKQFLGAGVADENPLEPGAFLFPANSTLVQPPQVGQNQAAVFNGGAWSVVDDYRGLIYYLADDSKHVITDFGVVPPLNALTSPPVTPAKLLSAVDSERSKRWRAGFPVQVGGVEKWFHSDEFSLTQHLGLKDKARDLLATGGVMTDNITIAGQPVVWSTMDGSQVTITAQLAFDLVDAAAVQQALVFAASKAHFSAIMLATDLTDYDPTSGWPAVYSDAGGL